MLRDDKPTAGLPYRGEASRLRIRRPRFDRDGLFLFGRRHGSQSLSVTADELTALTSGRWLAVDVLEEYILYIHLEEEVR
jgi:hypothetical protein